MEPIAAKSIHVRGSIELTSYQKSLPTPATENQTFRPPSSASAAQKVDSVRSVPGCWDSSWILCREGFSWGPRNKIPANLVLAIFAVGLQMACLSPVGEMFDGIDANGFAQTDSGQTLSDSGIVSDSGAMHDGGPSLCDACGPEPTDASTDASEYPSDGGMNPADSGTITNDGGGADAGANGPDAGDLTPNVMFISSGDVQPLSLGGLQGADNFCQQLATAANPPLQGHFVAFLSTSTVNARDRLRIPGTTHEARGWVRTDGKPFADTVSSLFDQVRGGAVYYPPLLDENGNEAPTRPVMTGSNRAGKVSAGKTCADWKGWTGEYDGGEAAGGTFEWSSNWTRACSVAARLYCFQTDFNTVVRPQIPPPGSRKAFLSSTAPAIGGGIAGLDAHCMSDAAGHGLPGNFKALVAGNGMSMVTGRFNLAGSPWFRIDGVQLVTAGADLGQPGGRLLAAPNVRSDGRYAFLNVWTGTPANGDALSLGAADTTCSDWFRAGSSEIGGMGDAASSRGWSSFSASWCDWASTAPVYCFEE